jgi:hypothetical protein
MCKRFVSSVPVSQTILMAVIVAGDLGSDMYTEIGIMNWSTTDPSAPVAFISTAGPLKSNEYRSSDSAGLTDALWEDPHRGVDP